MRNHTGASGGSNSRVGASGTPPLRPVVDIPTAAGGHSSSQSMGISSYMNKAGPTATSLQFDHLIALFVIGKMEHSSQLDTCMPGLRNEGH